VAAPFRTTEFDLMYNEGISTEGELLALGEKYGIIQKSGSSYSFGEEKLGRGYDASRTYLRENKKIANEVIKEIRKALAQLSGGGGFGNTEFTIVVQYTENDLGSVVDTIQRCTWGKTSSKAEENPDPLKEDVEFKCLSILWNGESLFDSSGEL
jgi:hypothetical protein